ncbi:hypothetical protein [Frigoribacterium sp. UYMn621]|uniref:hypothetical protein n=1 Tax=Frigoribacterium sp. UYMn621 TaxID=3156343 RepID=UPI00339257B2
MVDPSIPDLTAIRAHADAATEGPWDYVCQGVVAQGWVSSEDALDNPVATGRTDADGEFIAHARTDIPTLLDLVAALAKQVADAWDEGAMWAAVELGAVKSSSVQWIAADENPYRAASAIPTDTK